MWILVQGPTKLFSVSNAILLQQRVRLWPIRGNEHFKRMIEFLNMFMILQKKFAAFTHLADGGFSCVTQ